MGVGEEGGMEMRNTEFKFLVFTESSSFPAAADAKKRMLATYVARVIQTKERARI